MVISHKFFLFLTCFSLVQVQAKTPSYSITADIVFTESSKVETSSVSLKQSNKGMKGRVIAGCVGVLGLLSAVPGFLYVMTNTHTPNSNWIVAGGAVGAVVAILGINHLNSDKPLLVESKFEGVEKELLNIRELASQGGETGINAQTLWSILEGSGQSFSVSYKDINFSTQLEKIKIELRKAAKGNFEINNILGYVKRPSGTSIPSTSETLTVSLSGSSGSGLSGRVIGINETN